MKNGDETGIRSRANSTAFPISLDGHHYDGGLTKREYFAAMALQGLCLTWNSQDHIHAAKMAVEYADELLKALEK